MTNTLKSIWAKGFWGRFSIIWVIVFLYFLSILIKPTLFGEDLLPYDDTLHLVAFVVLGAPTLVALIVSSGFAFLKNLPRR